MKLRILIYTLVLVAAIFSIRAAYQFKEKQNNLITYKGEVDLSSGDTSLSSGGELNVRSTEAPGSRAVGVFSLSGEKIMALNDDKRWPIASLTKLMTAFIAFDNIRSDDRITITRQMIELTSGSQGDFKEGEEYSVSDLEKALLIVSNNTAAEALASHMGRDTFIKTMNDYAARFGLKDTRFTDPTGLSVGNQSTIQDLSALVRYILINRPEVFSISREQMVSITDIASGVSRELKNINQFAGRPDFIGGKTGTTPEAVGNLISIFHGTKIGEGFIIILLGTEDRFNETLRLLSAVLRK